MLFALFFKSASATQTWAVLPEHPRIRYVSMAISLSIVLFLFASKLCIRCYVNGHICMPAIILTTFRKANQCIAKELSLIRSLRLRSWSIDIVAAVRGGILYALLNIILRFPLISMHKVKCSLKSIQARSRLPFKCIQKLLHFLLCATAQVHLLYKHHVLFVIFFRAHFPRQISYIFFRCAKRQQRTQIIIHSN